MANDKRKMNRVLGGSQPESALTPEQVDAMGYGAIFASADQARVRADRISIFEIYPDPAQPRRAIPSVVREAWGQRDTETLFNAWVALASKEAGAPVDVNILLEQGGEVAEDLAPIMSGPAEASLLSLIDLAASIKRDGLTNPVTVINTNGRYRLETGERRWLAYQMLFMVTGDNHWEKIPARVMDEVSVWRQAAENSARQNLNAISKARQFALLLMDIHGRDQFQPIDSFEHEQGFYVQVEKARIPHGKGELLQKTLGVASRAPLSHYRSFLTLPYEVWTLGDDYNIPSENLYNWSRLPKEKAVAAARKFVLSQNTSGRRGSSRSDSDIIQAPGTNRHFSQTSGAIVRAGRGKASENEKALHYIEELEAWLAEHKRRILGYLR